MPYLKAATLQNDASAYYSYVYAVALENRGDRKAAIEVLREANQRWPNQYEILLYASAGTYNIPYFPQYHSAPLTVAS